jgi:cob(I)alamin adenosyltransferase
VELARHIRALPDGAQLPLILLSSGFMPGGSEGNSLFNVRLLKPAVLQAGELTSLSRLPGFELLDAGIGVIASSASAEEVATSVQRVFAAAGERIARGDLDLVIFDEINGAVRRNALPLVALLDFLDQRPPALEIVLTGRDAHPQVLSRAHLVTEMVAIKHPLAQGIAARRGIEY